MLTVDFDRLDLKPGHRFLDIGAGAGRHCYEAARRGAHVVALDYDADALPEVHAMLGAMVEVGEAPANVACLVIRGDALKLPFPDASFDRIVVSEVLEHIDDDAGVLAEIHQCRKRACHLAVGNAGLVDAEAFHVGLRQVDALLLPVHGHVLPEVDELQAGADPVGHGQVFGGVGAVEVQHQPAHRVGRAAAVVRKLGKICVAGLAHILAEGVEQVAKEPDRQLELADVVPKAIEDRGQRGVVESFILLDGVERPAVVVEPRQADDRLRVAFVGDVVGGAGKGVDGLDRLAQVRGQKEGRDGEVFVVVDGHGRAEYTRGWQGVRRQGG